MVFVPFNLVALIAFATYVTAALCWQQTRPVPAQAGQHMATAARRVCTSPTSRLLTNR